jgi:hypothetical protein
MHADAKALYGDSAALSSWSRGRDYSTLSDYAGLYFSVCEKIIYHKANPNGLNFNCFIGFFRNVRFDAAGSLRSVSTPRAYIVGPTW